MKRLLYFVCAAFLLTGTSAYATDPPAQVATIVIHGFSPDGASSTGTVGADYALSYMSDFAASAGLPTAFTDPTAPNQVAATTYYGDTYPSYYTQQDIDDVNAATATYGGGVPRYAAIAAKYAREVMHRSGATQVSLVGLSFGGLITRYIIEKDLEHLASNGKIARWIGIEGVIAGNYAATYGGVLAEMFFDQHYGGSPVDLEHMKYTWVSANIHDPYYTSECPWLKDFPTHFWLAGDDNLYNKTVTTLSGKANDGVVLLEDAILRNLPAQLLYRGLLPTESTLHANHETMKDNAGLRVGLAAQLFGRTRATVKLKDIEIKREFDGGTRGKGEYVFGVKFFSPLAASTSITTAPIQDLRAEDNSLPFVQLSPSTPQSLNLTWFDDMLLPGETQLRMETNFEEIDGDLIYQITEAADGTRQALQNVQAFIDVTKNGEYPLETDDWKGTVQVQVHQYPAFGSTSSAAKDWSLFD